jgi:hypothetical protein
MIRRVFKKVALLLGRSTIGEATIANSSDWPPLPSKGYIVGRAAQLDDVDKGAAVFVQMENDMVIGRPLAILIPQYARLRETHERFILVQAEKTTKGDAVLGIRGLDGKAMVVTLPELELLGTGRPLN